ncbi:MAG TPA: Ca2+-dependent phosphoinositide-specific phospholipase C [Polyangiales bacterium]
MKPVIPRLLTCLAVSLASWMGCARHDVMTLPLPLTRASARLTEETPVFAREADALRIDQLQLFGSHNSYHRAPRLALTRSFRYTHSPLAEQLSRQGVRHLELDVRYADGALRVGHAPIVDAGTQCHSFVGCIRAVASWSRANRDHVPIFVFVQPKEGLVGAGLDRRVGVLDREINSVFTARELLLPRQVARDFPSLRQAVHSVGWPRLAESRGKVAFVLFGHPRLVREYAAGRPRLEGRSMFVATRTAGAPYAAILSVDDPRQRLTQIREAVATRLLVRTRADADLTRDPRRRAAAIHSGAHFIGSDFVDPIHAWLDYGPDVPARQNPLTASATRTRRRVLELTHEQRTPMLRAGAPGEPPQRHTVAQDEMGKDLGIP